jgi:hypothetical protein
MTLKEPPGSVTVTMTATLADGRSEASTAASRWWLLRPVRNRPQPSSSRARTAPARRASRVAAGLVRRLLRWALANLAACRVVGAALIAGVAGLAVLAVNSFSAPTPGATLPVEEGRVYGWLEMLDGAASVTRCERRTLASAAIATTTSVLQNDSISRRHALLHFNADNRRFRITDLGGDNGVIVNTVKQQSHELSDGDLVELGEVRLRFRVNKELVGQ